MENITNRIVIELSFWKNIQEHSSSGWQCYLPYIEFNDIRMWTAKQLVVLNTNFVLWKWVKGVILELECSCKGNISKELASWIKFILKIFMSILAFATNSTGGLWNFIVRIRLLDDSCINNSWLCTYLFHGKKSIWFKKKIKKIWVHQQVRQNLWR